MSKQTEYEYLMELEYDRSLDDDEPVDPECSGCRRSKSFCSRCPVNGGEEHEGKSV